MKAVHSHPVQLPSVFYHENESFLMFCQPIYASDHRCRLSTSAQARCDNWSYIWSARQSISKSNRFWWQSVLKYAMLNILFHLSAITHDVWNSQFLLFRRHFHRLLNL